MGQKFNIAQGIAIIWLSFNGIEIFAATVTWDGGGGNFTWQTAANWSGDILPGANDDVFINVGGNITITSSVSVTIRSLQCSNHLALTAGTFRVGNVDSVVQGQLFVTGNPILSASGAFTSLVLPAATNIDGLGLDVSSGARVSLPSVRRYDKGSSCLPVLWQVTGTNSTLEAAALTNLTGASCASLTIQALSGGDVLVGNLQTVSEGTLVVLADGAGSLIDMATLQQSPGTLRSVSFETRNNGVISMPQFTGGKNVSVTQRPGGTLPIAQFTELNGFTVSATNADFSSLTNLYTGNITVNSNAVVTATNLVNYPGYNSCLAPIWLATGAGSVLDFSHITNMTGLDCGLLALQAKAGGIFNLSNVASIAEGSLTFSADGTNSVINLSALQQCNAAARNVEFDVSNSGTILMPLFAGSPRVFVSLASGGNLPAGQLRELTGFSVTGMNVNFTALTNVSDGNVTVNGGAIVTAPVLLAHSQAVGCFGNTWLVSGAGSIFDLSHLVSLTGAGCGNQNFSAMAGGLMNLSNLASISDGTVTFLADGTNSVVNLSALAQIAGPRTVTFSVANAGTITAPLFSGNTNAFVTVQSGGSFPAAQMRRLSGFAVSGMTVNFSGLTNLAAGNVTVNSGGMASAPNLTRHNEFGGCIGNTWSATGAGSVLDFTSLTNLTGADCGGINFNGTAGGHILLGNLSSLAEGSVSFLADGTNSVIDLSSLTQSFATNHSVSLEARNAGVILVPILQGGQTLAVTIRSGGSLDTSQLNLLKSLTVSGTSLSLPGITNLFSGDLIVDQGAVLSFPNLFRHTQANGCVLSTWSVSGAGSMLDLSSMTNITGSTCGSLNINALAGGLMNLSNLVTISDGIIAFLGDGANSRVNLAALQNSFSATRMVSFEARNFGNVAMSQNSGGATVALTIKTNGVMPTAQLKLLNSVTVLGTNVVLNSLTNIDGGSLTVSNAGTIIAPSLVSYAKGLSCVPAAWLASGTGSVLNLSSLGYATGGGCTLLNVVAINGGQMLLGGLGEIPSGAVSITSSGPASFVDLHSLSNFLNATALSKLIATNGGAVQLNDQPLFLSGVSVNFAAGTPGFPLTVLAPTNLIMHAHAWRSYWAEVRDTSSSSNPWLFFRRIPLTNDFQIIGPLAAANTEFRAWEFVADPFLLELIRASDGVDLILYGPANRSFEVQATTNVTTPLPWPAIYTVSMTNTFRLLPREAMNLPQRYFTADPL
jgi:hypothetical protein